MPKRGARGQDGAREQANDAAERADIGHYQYIQKYEKIYMKNPAEPPPIANMEAKAEQAARLLATLAHGKRLMALCHLLQGEKPVGQLAALAGLSSTALSQHLARMRDLGLVETRREGQSIFCRLASPEVVAILETLHRLFCAPQEGPLAAPVGEARDRL